jgi:hypothetical protein
MNTIAKLIRAALVVMVIGNVLFATAQSEALPKPAAAPTPTPGATADAKKVPGPVTGTIKGRMVSNDGQPLANATVVAQSNNGSFAVKPTRPDADGRFAFDDLVPGAYSIFGTAPGYIDQSVVLSDPNSWQRHLIGSNVRINMIRGGVITGMVTNAKGEPMVGVPVHATLSNSTSGTFNFFTGSGVSETDDRGNYRIYGLMPGQYIVNAGGEGAFGRFTPSGFDRDVQTYYPSSTRDTAVPVSVRSGDETTGIDIKYKGTEGHSLSGFVLGDIPPGGMNSAITIMLAHAGTSSIAALGLAIAAEQRRPFSFNGVADGEYDLFASYLSTPTENALSGEKHVTVRGGDVTGIELRLMSLGSLAGTIKLEPIKQEDKCDKRESQVIETVLRVPPDDPKKAMNRSPAAIYSGLEQLNEKGEFVLRNLTAAKYRLDIKLPTESWYVRAIDLPAAARAGESKTPATQPAATTLSGWQGVVTIKPGESLSGVSIMVGQDAAIFRGRVTPGGTTIREGTHVYLVPTEREQANNVLRYSDTLVKSDGSFALGNLAPGRYYILSRVEAPTDPDTLPRPIAWDAAARARLRREAEAANTIIELKPCQQVDDYELKIGG